MPRFREWVERLRGTLRRGRSDRDLEEELRLHLELAAEDARRGGDSPPDAARVAAVRSGGLVQAMEAMRDQRGVPALSDLAGDLRYACRGLARNPGFTLTSIASLALGIGAITAIFSVVNAVMLRTLPVREPEALVELLTVYPGEPRRNGFDWQTYQRYRDHNDVFSDLVGTSPASFDVRLDGAGVESVRGAFVVGRFFPALGMDAAAGRMLGPGDDTGGAASVAVVSDSLWRRRFQRDPGIIGSQIDVNGVPATIVGVAPRGFEGLQIGRPIDLWVPASSASVIQRPGPGRSEKLGLALIGRLKPGVSLAAAQAEMRVLDRPRVEEIARSSKNPGWLEARLDLAPAGAGFSALRDVFAAPLLVLMAVVGLLLLIACANIASMLLARAAARQREMAVRVSLGAGPWRLVRQVLTESIVLSAIGTSLGVGLAYAGAPALWQVLVTGRRLPPIEVQVQPDVTVLLFTAGVAAVTALLFGLAPAWQALSFAPASSLREIRSAREPGSPPIAGGALVVAQVVLSVVLLSAAGLFIDHLSSLRDRGLGFDRHSVLLLKLEPKDSGLDVAQSSVLYRELLERLEAIPGVRSATSLGVIPTSGAGWSRMARVEGFVEKPEDRRYLVLNPVAPKYFETLGTPLVAGRDFAFDDAARPRVAIINQAMARHYFSGRDPIGKHITFDDDDRQFEIVGVAADAKYYAPHEPPPRAVYLNAFQEPRLPSNVALRTDVPPTAVAEDARRVIASMSNAIRLDSVRTLAEIVNASVVPERLIAALSVLFGALGALLAGIGLYGLLAYTVARRTNEIGIRMALGATEGDVMRMVVRGALGLVAAGLAIGTVLAMWSERFAVHILENLQVDGARPVALAVTIMLALAIVAAYGPARRAARVQPMDALRHD
jgi:predicted permease